jgi:DNA-binding NarL/FixJ family response regulator
MSSVTVAILSSDRIFCEGLRRIIAGATSFDVQVVDDAVAADAAAAPNVDILILDSRTKNALALCARFRDDDRLSIILAAGPSDHAWAVDAVTAGARGVLLENAPVADVLRAIDIVRTGQMWVPRHVVAMAWTRHARAAAQRERETAAILQAGLSTREREVFRHAAAGLSNGELARRLSVSTATVKVHLMHIFRKLGVRRRSELAAAYHGLVPIDQKRSSIAPARRPV